MKVGMGNTVQSKDNLRLRSLPNDSQIIMSIRACVCVCVRACVFMSTPSAKILN